MEENAKQDGKKAVLTVVRIPALILVALLLLLLIGILVTHH